MYNEAQSSTNASNNQVLVKGGKWEEMKKREEEGNRRAGARAEDRMAGVILGTFLGFIFSSNSKETASLRHFGIFLLGADPWIPLHRHVAVLPRSHSCSDVLCKTPSHY